MQVLAFPDGSRVRACPLAERVVDDPDRALGLYLDRAWEPTWPAVLIDWPDYGVPADAEAAATEIVRAFDRARAGELVEVGCLGGRGRTGTVLACMAVLAGVPAVDAVEWVRETYVPEAVETAAQAQWVLWFAEWTLSDTKSV